MSRVLACLALLVVPFSLQGQEPPKGFISLFNGKDLAGWKATGKKEVWGAENNAIYVQGGGGGWLLTEKEYGDFELRLEYKMPKAGNSGIALRTPPTGDPAYVGMEIQLIDDVGWPGKLANWQATGSIYNVVPAKKVNNRPVGEWNQMRIVCNGRKVLIEQNGETLVDANLDDYMKDFKRHSGLLRDKGHLGFQSYNARVEFRNIYLRVEGLTGCQLSEPERRASVYTPGPRSALGL